MVTEARLAALAHSPTIVASAEGSFKDLTENVHGDPLLNAGSREKHLCVMEFGWVALVALLAAPPAFAVSNSPFGCPPSETVTTDPSENPDPATDDDRRDRQDAHL